MGGVHPRPTALQLRRAALGALILAAGGCTSDGPRRDLRDDPLLGSGARPSNQPVAIATANPNGSTPAPAMPAYQPRPPITPASPTNNAALAAGGFQPLSGGSDLRIGNGQPLQPAFTDPRATQQPGGPVPIPGSGGGPIPVPPPNAAGAMTPVSGSGVSALDQAYAAAAAREPLFTKLQFNAEAREWTFTMKVRSKLNSSMTPVVEGLGTSASEAIYRAIQQIDNESR